MECGGGQKNPVRRGDPFFQNKHRTIRVRSRARGLQRLEVVVEEEWEAQQEEFFKFLFQSVGGDGTTKGE